MTAHSLRLCSFAAILFSIPPSVARAQSAEAQELFDEGRRALAAGDYAKACAKLEASERIERAVGTLLSLAECEEALGQLASERLHLQEAATWAEATHDPLNRGPLARKRFAEIDRRVPRLTLQRAPDAPADTRVSRDGVDLGAAAFDAELPMDSGSHAIVASAPGRASASYDVTLREGERRVLVVGPSGAGQSPMERPSEPLGLPRRTWAYVLGGVGVAGIALGTVFGVSTLSKWSAAQRDCGSGCPDGSPARSEASEASTDAIVSTVAFVAAGAALAAGAYFYFTSRPASPASGTVRVAPWIAQSAGGASLGGAW
ncbi:MAG TPA: hypothetical protein VF765_10810 [Polyangiaceae bacterium]